MDGFTSNLVANLVGTFVGAALALLGAWWLERRYVASQERSRLQGLVDRVYRSRALAPNRTRTRPDQPLSLSEETDRVRCAQSIIATRDQVAGISERISVYLPVIPLLDRMYVACLNYLETAEDPPRYVAALMALRADLITQLAELQKVIPSLIVREPGTAYLDAQPGPLTSDDA